MASLGFFVQFFIAHFNRPLTFFCENFANLKKRIFQIGFTVDYERAFYSESNGSKIVEIGPL